MDALRPKAMDIGWGVPGREQGQLAALHGERRTFPEPGAKDDRPGGVQVQPVDPLVIRKSQLRGHAPQNGTPYAAVRGGSVSRSAA